MGYVLPNRVFYWRGLRKNFDVCDTQHSLVRCVTNGLCAHRYAFFSRGMDASKARYYDDYSLSTETGSGAYTVKALINGCEWVERTSRHLSLRQYKELCL